MDAKTHLGHHIGPVPDDELPKHEDADIQAVLKRLAEREEANRVSKARSD